MQDAGDKAIFYLDAAADEEEEWGGGGGSRRKRELVNYSLFFRLQFVWLF
jgi:hypothetical protein